ncbi:MAG: hypothetical protein J6S58_03220, partial [Lentisphaeria bacterium]|nr:hypothetical protein [Lentisphaeria bacterium]
TRGMCPSIVVENDFKDVIDESVKPNKALDELTLQEMQSVIPEADENMTKIFAPERAVEMRDVYGGTGYKQVESQLAFWEEHLKTAAEQQ